MRDRGFRNTSIGGYVIYNDSLQPVANLWGDIGYYYCNSNKIINSRLDDLYLYAMKNQYLLFHIGGSDGNIYFGYKDGHLVVFDSSGIDLKIYPFEEFDWDRVYPFHYKQIILEVNGKE